MDVGYINKEVRAMYGIPLSKLTPTQRQILRKDGERRAKLIEERQKAVMRDNRKAFDDEAVFERKLSEMYKEAQNSILADVTKTVAEVESMGGVWSYANQSALTRSKGLFDQINTEIKRLGIQEVSAFNDFLTTEYTEQFTRALFTLGQTIPLTGEGAFAMLNPRLVQATLNYPWSGAMFSDRLWIDKERLGQNLRQGLTQSMILGEGIPKIAKRINDKINTSQYNAERVARTETKRVCYTSQRAAWESQHINEVRYMTAGNGTGANICEVCREDHDKVFKLGEEPTLPRHPNCRCWYVPVTPDTFQPGELNELTNSVRGAENYENWMWANSDKINPDGTLKDGWVRDWKNGGKLVYKPDEVGSPQKFQYKSVDEYKGKISDMDKEIKALQEEKLATTGVLKGIYTPEEKGYKDLSSVAQIDKDITLRMKSLEKKQIELEYEMKEFEKAPKSSLKSVGAFRYHSMEEYEKKLDELEREWGSHSGEVNAGYMVRRGFYTREEMGFAEDLNLDEMIEREEKLKKQVEKEKQALYTEMEEFRKAQAPTTVPLQVSTQKGFYFNDGTSSTVTKKKRDAVISTTPDGIRIVVPSKLDTSKQLLDAQMIADLLQEVPTEVRKHCKEIQLVDYYNPQDSYWAKQYKMKHFYSYATGGGGKITFYRNDTRRGTNTFISNDDDWIKKVFSHEIGHTIDEKVATVIQKAVSGYGSDGVKWADAVAKDLAVCGESWVSSYATQSQSKHEDFADSVAEFVLNPISFKKRFPNRFKYIEEVLKQL